MKKIFSILFFLIALPCFADNAPTAWPNSAMRSETFPKLVTGQQINAYTAGLDVIDHGSYYLVGTDTVDSATTTTITAASHSAAKGDVLRFTSGTYSGQEFTVLATTTNTIRTGQVPYAAWGAGDAFQILRSRSRLIDSSGKQITIVSDATTGNNLSIIPVATETGLNGVPVLNVGTARITNGTITTGSTTSVIQITGIQAAGARVNDYLVLTTPASTGNSGAYSVITAVSTNSVTVSPAFTTAPANNDGYRLERPVQFSMGYNASQTNNSLFVDINANAVQANGPSILKVEDAGHASGDAGVFALGVRNSALNTITSTDGDYSPIAVNLAGAPLVDIQWTKQQSTALGLLKKEDDAHTTADAAVPSLAVREDALTASTSATGDYSNLKTDSSGRLITTMAPMGESFTSCSTSATGVTDVAIKAAVASNRIYVTSISCVNTAAAVSTELAIDDGATLIDVGYVASTTLGHSQWTKTYPVPLRGSVNTALNVKPTTTSSATRCCAQGYISTQ